MIEARSLFMSKPSRFRRVAVAVLTCAALLGCPRQEQAVDLTSLPEPGDVHWLRFALFTDIHITDEESPARAVRGDIFIDESWRPQEVYAPHVLDATVAALNALHASGKQAGRPLDFVIATGDLTDNAQHNELRWFIDIMDGQWVVPDSGAIDGPFRDVAPEDNPKLGFQATGLAPDVPWYTVFGNHDGLAVGVFAICRIGADPAGWFSPQFPVVMGMLGYYALDPPALALSPTANQSPAVILGSGDFIDPVTAQLDMLMLRGGPIVADPARHYLSRELFVGAHFDTTTSPVGHGFTESNRATGRTRYTIRPKPEVPIRLIVLDTAAPTTPYGLPIEFGVMTREQFESFLKPELDKAATAGEHVVVVTHHPSEHFDRLYPAQTVRTAEFRALLASQPNVIAHVCGHEHRNRTIQVAGPYPYVEIETASLIDSPQEARILDIFHDETTGDVRVETFTLGHATHPTRLSAESFRRAEIDASRAKDAGAGLTWEDVLSEKSNSFDL
jgi:3',5'-cyclic AMP phosphodiesterase CpdA